jgi:uncharacterized protein (TIGR03083 family)
MDRDDCISAIRTHGIRLADAADAAGLDAPVPSCPDWAVADLVRHVTGVADFWTALGSGRIEDPADFAPRPDRAEGALVAGFRTDVEAMASTLAAIDPATPCWTWTDRHDVGFVQRRMAHELAVHAWDATLAAGRPEPIEPALAVDGVDEYLDVFVPTRAGHADGPPLTAHLHATDVDGEWFVRMGDGIWSVERAHAKGEVAIRGAASDLLLLLWGRRDAAGDEFEVFGEPDAVTSFARRIANG